LAQNGQPFPTTRGKKAIVADFDKALGQDVLEKAADELEGRQGTDLEFASIRSPVAEGHFAVCQLEDAMVADGDAEDVWSEILQGGQATAHRLAVDDPILLPDCVRDLGKAVGLAQSVAELGAKDTGEGSDGE
jgi:hypothetical protein